MRTIVILDDDSEQAEVMAQALAGPAQIVRAFSDPASALHSLEHHPADVMIVDLSMPWMDGETVVLEVRRRCPSCRMVLVSGLDEVALVAARLGVEHQRKPLDLARLRRTIDGDGDPVAVDGDDPPTPPLHQGGPSAVA